MASLEYWLRRALEPWWLEEDVRGGATGATRGTACWYSGLDERASCEEGCGPLRLCLGKAMSSEGESGFPLGLREGGRLVEGDDDVTA